MKLETFFEKFDLLAEAPGGVGKLRELVLELAVRGRLVQQRTDEGDARSIFAGGKSRDGLQTEREGRFEVPSTWCWVRFGLVGDQRLGKMLDQKGNRGELKPYLRNTNVQWMRFELDDVKELRLEPDELAEYRLEPGDLLVCEGGEPGRCAIWRDADREMYFQKALHRVRPRRGVLAEYLAMCLRADARSGALDAAFTGATIKHLTGRALAEYTVPIPPSGEQTRIVARVDALMALCDRLQAQHGERETRRATLAHAALTRFAEAPTPANLNFLFHDSYAIEPAHLRKAIVTLALQGKLVGQDQKDEPASRLLQRLSKARMAQLLTGYPNPSEANTQVRKQTAQVVPAGLPCLPPGWAWATLMQASLLVVDCHNKTAPYVSSGIRLLRTTNIRDGRLNLSEPRFVDEVTYKRWSARCAPEPGDLLITREAPMGEACLIPAGMKVCLGQRMMLIRPVSGTMDPSFLLLSLRDPALMERVQDKPVGATVEHLRVGGVETLLLPVPPLAEQRRIVAKVDDLMLRVDRLERLGGMSERAAESLGEAVSEALAPQAPAGEPGA